MYNYDQNIKICSACNGWAFDSAGRPCTQCEGRDVYIDNQGQIYFLDIPMYIDFGLRKKILLLRSIVLVSLIIICLLIFISLIFMLYQIFI